MFINIDKFQQSEQKTIKFCSDEESLKSISLMEYDMKLDKK